MIFRDDPRKMARTKQTVRKSTGGKTPRKELATLASRINHILSTSSQKHYFGYKFSKKNLIFSYLDIPPLPL